MSIMYEYKCCPICGRNMVHINKQNGKLYIQNNASREHILPRSIFKIANKLGYKEFASYGNSVYNVTETCYSCNYHKADRVYLPYARGGTEWLFGPAEDLVVVQRFSLFLIENRKIISSVLAERANTAWQKHDIMSALSRENECFDFARFEALVDSGVKLFQ